MLGIESEAECLFTLKNAIPKQYCTSLTVSQLKTKCISLTVLTTVYPPVMDCLYLVLAKNNKVLRARGCHVDFATHLVAITSYTHRPYTFFLQGLHRSLNSSVKITPSKISHHSVSGTRAKDK